MVIAAITIAVGSFFVGRRYQRQLPELSQESLNNAVGHLESEQYIILCPMKCDRCRRLAGDYVAE